MMARYYKLMFAVCLVALCWYGMMAIHELGHVIGAWATGGTVTRVMLHPLSISRTDVSPNPSPGIVVWLGPVVGSLLPLLLPTMLSRRGSLRNVFRFFAGFCLIANGAYISVGSWDGIGDSGQMLQCGAPVWMLVAFGAVTVPGGLMIWHRLGSVRQFFAVETTVTPMTVYATVIALSLLLLAELALFPK
jgi:hypothetical protein